MNKISKPHIVDFLRLADQNKWFSPRIRYASVRSKPELIADLRHRFLDQLDGTLIHFLPRHLNACLPSIEYCLERRKFLLDGSPVNVPKVSRDRPGFSIDRRAVTLDFGCPQPSPASPSTGPASAASSMSGELSIDDLGAALERIPLP